MNGPGPGKYVCGIGYKPGPGPILWARSASPVQAKNFLRAMGGRISVFGHDVIPEGFEIIGDEQKDVRPCGVDFRDGTAESEETQKKFHDAAIRDDSRRRRSEGSHERRQLSLLRQQFFFEHHERRPVDSRGSPVR